MSKDIDRDAEDVRLLITQLHSQQRLYERRLRRVKAALDALYEEVNDLGTEQLVASMSALAAQPS